MPEGKLNRITNTRLSQYDQKSIERERVGMCDGSFNFICFNINSTIGREKKRTKCYNTRRDFYHLPNERKNTKWTDAQRGTNAKL